MGGNDRAVRLEVYLQTFNVFNQVNFINYGSVITSDYFGDADGGAAGAPLRNGHAHRFLDAVTTLSRRAPSLPRFVGVQASGFGASRVRSFLFRNPGDQDRRKHRNPGTQEQGARSCLSLNVWPEMLSS